MYNSFFDYLSSMSHRDWDDIVFSHRVDLLEEACVTLDIIPSHSKSRYGGEHRRFLGAMIKATDEGEPFLMPSRNLNEWLPYGSSSCVSWIDKMIEKELLTFNRETRLLEATSLLKKLTVPTMTALEL
jgi:hypothetical protein